MGREKLVLIIDDDEDMREVLREKIYISFGNKIRVIEAKDGLEATRKLEHQSFDCIITDMKMPRRDGIEFIQWVKESRHNKHAPVILITGYGRPDNLEDFKNVYLLEKPFNEADFLRILKTQILLGKTDQRVPSEILETLSKATLTYLQASVDNDVQFGKPQVKKPGEGLPGDLLGCISVKTKEISARISVAYSQDFVEHLRENLPRSRGGGPVVNGSMDSIFRLMGNLILKMEGKPPVYDEKRFLSDKKCFEAQELDRRAAIVIPVETPFGSLYLLAFGGPAKPVSAHTSAS